MVFITTLSVKFAHLNNAYHVLWDQTTNFRGPFGMISYDLQEKQKQDPRDVQNSVGIVREYVLNTACENFGTARIYNIKIKI